MYVGIGTIMFNAWEDWDWITASYFSFVTLTSVGFGDYIPVESFSDFESFEGRLRALVGSFYCILGSYIFIEGERKNSRIKKNPL